MRTDQQINIDKMRNNTIATYAIDAILTSWRAALCSQHVTVGVMLLCKAKISNLEISVIFLGYQQQVFRLNPTEIKTHKSTR